MKRITKISTLVLGIFLFSFTFFSCSKKDQQDIVNKYVNSLSATVTNTSTSANASFSASNTNAAKNGSQLTIDGANGNQRITLAINNWTGSTGTYSLGATGNPNIAAYNTGVGSASDIIATSGNIVITDVDNNTYTNGPVITASFNFVASNYTISSGAFKVFVHN